MLFLHHWHNTGHNLDPYTRSRSEDVRAGGPGAVEVMAVVDPVVTACVLVCALVEPPDK